MTEKELDENLKNSLNRIENLIEKWCEENKSPTLYKIIHDELGYSHDCTAEIIDAVKNWLPKECRSSDLQTSWMAKSPTKTLPLF
jgi:hypothetical protein